MTQADRSLAWVSLSPVQRDAPLAWVVEQPLVEDIPDLRVTLSPEMRISSDVSEVDAVLLTMRHEVTIAV